ncbi:BatA domain-containing protein [Fontivita pretiosa]|uniref:BatA domain-containing protein n=1 Tax=Fontivita pretiosa TaxID=2989684 RepID=UPI003D1750FA
MSRASGPCQQYPHGHDARDMMMSGWIAILAIGFVTPGFVLAGILLASIPIIIHILNRRRFRTVQWAAMTFLLQALRKNRRRLRFEQWLLLAVRCSVLALLGLALARPMGCERSSLATIAGRRAGLHVLIIDNSYSMAYQADRPDARTHLDQARLLAKRVIDRLSAGGESVVLITASQPAAAVIAKPTYDLEAAKAAVDRVQQSYSGTDLLGALQKALEIGREESAQPSRSLYIFSDSTRSAWEAPPAEALASLGRELASIYRIAHFNLARQGQWNHAVLSVKPTANLVRAQFENAFQALVRGYGASTETHLQWKLDDQPLPGGGPIRPELNTPPQTQAQAQIQQGGLHVISASLASDNRLKVDDTRWRVIDVAAEMRVLIVEGERGIGPLASSGAFLQLALAPPSEEGARFTATHARTRSYILPEVISDLEFGNKVLGEYRAVILAGVSQLSPPQADQLRAFVQQGGTVVVFMGEAVSAEAYNQVLLPRGLMPGTLSRRMSVAGDQQPFHFDVPRGGLHPLLAIFENQEQTGLQTAQVFTYWRVELPNDGHVERVLNYQQHQTANANSGGGADPAITVHSLGEGRVVFVSTTAGAEWTTLPAKPAYVPLMHELICGSVSAADRWLNLLVGQTLQIPPTLKLTTVPTLKDPQQAEVVLEQTQAPDGRAVYRSRPLEKPGVYTLTTGAKSIPIAVNVPEDEADIRPLEAAAIQKALGGIDLSLFDEQLPPPAESEHAGNDFGWSVMILVLMLVGLECFLAMRFGHYRR